MWFKFNNNLEICLRSLVRNDDFRVRKWLSDPYIVEMTFVIPGPEQRKLLPFDVRTMDQYIEILLSDRHRKTYAIEASGQHIGNIGLKEIDVERKKAELFIEIGEAKFRSKGIGKAAMMILMDYFFHQMGYQEMILEVLEFNKAALRVYEQIGFRLSHRSSWHCDAQGRYWQVWLMRLGRERWIRQRDLISVASNLRMQGLKAA
ncbi:MAG: GNAT family N-acetyltransferase [Myxococcaceae bacterium]|nr:GNAT family N-acetyltransferase [Myxococcaceae bacterium]MBH2006476.1 GNAT family N-acetyltransferase [Myxococcaceae bacterium]